MKKLLICALTAALLAGLCLPVSAAHVSAEEAISTLETLELVRGTGDGFAPERSASRSEAAVMLLRLLGKEAAALAETDACPFADGGWASAYLTYAQKNGLVKGVSDRYFGGTDAVGVRDYLTMVLRALGYSDSGENADFSWAESIAFADGIGLTHGEYKAADAFLREDMALVSYTALTLPMKGSEDPLIRHLYLQGAVSGSALRKTRLAFAATAAEKQVRDAAEIHELAASAVFLVEMFDDGAPAEKTRPDACGSGFFVTDDGVAVLCCHELDGHAYARVTTLDGRCYPITEVLHYDPLWDTAVVRVAKTDLKGNSVRFFPYLTLGDSDAVYSGERIYTVSNPLGHVDSISDGMVANSSRIVDDPAYRMIQITAPITQGSSGGPMLNAYGEVEGIVFGTFIGGQNMNLAIPINQIDRTGFSRTGISLKSMLEERNAQKAAATLKVSQNTLYLRYESEAEVLVTEEYPGTASVSYNIVEPGVVECVWGSFQTKQSVPLYVTAVGNGETDIEISFTDEEENDTVVTIHVTVYGAPETEPSEESEP